MPIGGHGANATIANEGSRMTDDPIKQRIAADMQELKRRLRRQQMQQAQHNAEGRPRCTDLDGHDPLLAALEKKAHDFADGDQE
jgi:hypothetical protein